MVLTFDIATDYMAGFNGTNGSWLFFGKEVLQISVLGIVSAIIAYKTGANYWFASFTFLVISWMPVLALLYPDTLSSGNALKKIATLSVVAMIISLFASWRYLPTTPKIEAKSALVNSSEEDPSRRVGRP